VLHRIARQASISLFFLLTQGKWLAASFSVKDSQKIAAP